jgi:hypothetical protein
VSHGESLVAMWLAQPGLDTDTSPIKIATTKCNHHYQIDTWANGSMESWIIVLPRIDLRDGRSGIADATRRDDSSDARDGELLNCGYLGSR